MTEAEWRASTDPMPMLLHLGEQASSRKVRLYACACAHRVWERLADERSRQAVVTAERFADGLADAAELAQAFRAAQQGWDEMPEVEGNRRVAGNKALTAARRARRAARVARDAATPPGQARLGLWAGLGESAARRAALADLLRDIFPFRPVAVDPSWLAWDGGTIPRLALAIYDERAFDRLPILGDALEEAGCTDLEVLGHCRGEGVHVRGCWLVDALAGKS
jgi:hypothetical protein